ncbi:MAG: hypothetical protein ACRBBP_02665 [Bdellovibrionales bacterium]
MNGENDSENENKVLSLFDDLGDGLSEVKPLTRGLGFKDRVSEGVYTMEMDSVDTVDADGGTLDIGHESFGDGVLNIDPEGGLKLETSETVQPILFHSGHDGLIKKTAKKSGESLLGAFIDVLLVVAVTILTVAVLTEFTRFFFDFAKIAKFNFNELGKVAVVFSAYFLSYKIFSRVFFGKTLGEWSSRHQLGLLLQQNKLVYPFQVLAREIACLVTAVFFLPILSMVFKKDVGYYFSGLQTYIEQKK